MQVLSQDGTPGVIDITRDARVAYRLLHLYRHSHVQSTEAVQQWLHGNITLLPSRLQHGIG
jgi:hypothetical protein